MADLMEINKILRQLGYITFPSYRDESTNNIHPFYKWTEIRDRLRKEGKGPTKKIYEDINKDFKNPKCCAVMYIPGVTVDEDGNVTKFRPFCIDSDNLPGTNEVYKLNNKNPSLEGLGEIEAGFLEISDDGQRLHWHGFTYDEQLPKEKLNSPEGRESKTPAIECISDDTLLATVGKPGYSIIGEPRKFADMSRVQNYATIKKFFDNIKEKYNDEFCITGNGVENKTNRILIETNNPVHAGTRKRNLHSYACYKLRVDWDNKKSEEIKQDVIETNQKRCIPPLEPVHVDDVWKYAYAFIGKQIELEKANGPPNKTNEKQYDELRNNVYYQINKLPAKYIIASRQNCQVIEVVEKSYKSTFLSSNYLYHNKSYLACIPTKIIRHNTSIKFLENSPKYTIEFLDSSGEIQVYKQKTLSEIIQGLREQAYILSEGADMALSALIRGFKQNGLLEDNSDIAQVGFFNHENKIIANNIIIKKPATEALKNALSFVSELEPYYESRLDLLATSIKWAMIAPVMFILKRNNYHLRLLHFYGFPNTTKTNTGMIILAIDGHQNDVAFTLTLSRFDTIARVGAALGHSTFPILVDEMDLTDKQWLVELLKSIPESQISRSKFPNTHANDTVNIPALSLPILTGNPRPPLDESAYMKRVMTRFSSEHEVIPDDSPESKAFRKLLIDKLSDLKALGDFRNCYVMNNQEQFLDDGKPEPMELGLRILRSAYQDVGMKIPEWLVKEILAENQLQESIEDNKAIVKGAFEKYVIEHLNRALPIWRQKEAIGLPTNTSERLKDLAIDKLLPHVKWNPLKYGITISSGILEELRRNGISSKQLPNLKALADQMGAEYKIYSGRMVVFADVSVLTKYFDTPEDLD